MFIKQYDTEGTHTGYKKGNAFYTLDYNLPENAEIDDGNKPSASEILSTLKANKITEIDQKTESLILAGYEHDGKVYSTSENAQRNLIAIMINAENIQWNNDYPTKDKELISMSKAEFVALYSAVFNNISSIRRSGIELANQVSALTTVKKVNDFVDNR